MGEKPNLQERNRLEAALYYCVFGNKNRAKAMSRYEWTMTMLTGALVLVTTVYAVFAAGQWKELHRTTALSREEFELSQGAVVLAGIPELDFSRANPVAQLPIANLGRQRSGPVMVTFHVAFSTAMRGPSNYMSFNRALLAKIDMAKEVYCMKSPLAPISPSFTSAGSNLAPITPNPIRIAVPIIGLQKDQPFEIGKSQVAVIAGPVSFFKGFAYHDIYAQTQFCNLLIYRAGDPHVWRPCDPAVAIPALQKKDRNCQIGPPVDVGDVW